MVKSSNDAFFFVLQNNNLMFFVILHSASKLVWMSFLVWGLRELQIALRNGSALINPMHCSSLPYYDTVFNVGVEHLQDLHGVLTDNGLSCDGIVTVHPLRVM